jgi:hypothetical protein
MEKSMPTTRTYRTHRTTNYAHHPAGGGQYSRYNPTQFRNANQEIQWRLGSYRNIYSQFNGAGTTPFSPTNANKWIRYVNTGTRVYKFNNQQFTNYFGFQWNNSTPNATYRWMRQKFGAGIKAVARGKGNCWLVAATERITARPFCNYTWK